MIVPVVIGLCIIRSSFSKRSRPSFCRAASRAASASRVLFYPSTWLPMARDRPPDPLPKSARSVSSVFRPALPAGSLRRSGPTLLIFGFGLLYYGKLAHDPTRPVACRPASISAAPRFSRWASATSRPTRPLERVLAIFESGLGFGFLALIISYLPVIYQAFSKREVNIVLLDARAGSPPTAAELLLRHAGPHGLDALLILFRDWERWSAELLESHISYPVVSYFRSQHNNESWLGALAAILDSTALLIATSDNPCSRQARLTFAMCRHTVADLAQVFFATPRNSGADRLPPADLQRMRQQLASSGLPFLNTPESCAKLDKLRQMYEPYLEALSAHLYVELPPWILAKEVTDNWSTSAWGRISGFSPSETASATDDH